MNKPRIIEVVFIEAILYILLWLWNDFIATILSLSFAGIAFSVLIISLAAERFDKSKISAWYFYGMAVSFVVPIVVGIFFSVLKHGNLNWMKF
jgi:ABC-type Fe3+-siderophore transport system permease subunit